MLAHEINSPLILWLQQGILLVVSFILRLNFRPLRFSFHFLHCANNSAKCVVPFCVFLNYLIKHLSLGLSRIVCQGLNCSIDVYLKLRNNIHIYIKAYLGYNVQTNIYCTVLRYLMQI